jgi:hypothetical protein
MALDWEQVIVDAADPGSLGRWWAAALEWVVVNDDPEEFEIRPAPDRVPGLLFVRVPEPKRSRTVCTSTSGPTTETPPWPACWASAPAAPTSAKATNRGSSSPIRKATSSACSRPVTRSPRQAGCCRALS